MQVNETKRVNELDQKTIQTLEPYQEKAQSLSTTINTVSSLLSENILFSELLTEIGGLMPSGTALTGLEVSVVNLQAPLVVSAQTNTEERAAVLLNNLNQSDLFEGASIRSLQSLRSNADGGSTSTSQGSYNYIVVLDVQLKNTEDS